MPIRIAAPCLSWLLAACVCLPVAARAQAPGFLRTDGTRIVDAAGRPVLLRGMGLGGWMLKEGYMLELPQFGTQRVIHARIAELIGEDKARAFEQAWLDHHTTKADIDAMAAWGFNSIRLPMHYALYTAPVDEEPVRGGQTWREEGFRRTDQLLAWAKANRMVVILDLHAAPGGQGNDLNISDRDPAQPSLWDDPAQQDKFVALWRELARRYRNEPAVAAYDLINEPNWGFTDPADRNGCTETGNAPLRTLLQRTTAAIREIDKRHIIVIEGNCWGNNYRGMLDDGLWDDNVVLSFHRYWSPVTRDGLADMLALRERLRVPLWLGETGENSNDWFARMVALAESEDIGWSWWPLKKIRDNNPLQIVPNPGYRRLLAWWDGSGPKPTAAQAEAALMELATRDVRFEHNVQHPDVVDALFRAPHSERAVPFKAHAIGARGGVIAAVDFDMGRDGIAYHDRTTANESGKPDAAPWNPTAGYRNDGVDLGRDDDGRWFVASLEPGEWLAYTFDAARGGDYDLSFDMRRGGRAIVRLNGDLRGTGAADAPLRRLPVLQGRNTLVIEAGDATFDLRTLTLKRGD